MTHENLETAADWDNDTMSRITIHMGHYGSGKTELSLNRIHALHQQNLPVTLVDLDIVNPYFRSGEHKEELEALGVRVIRPNFEGTNVDVPSLPAEIMSIFADRTSQVIIDVGGDPSGASALGRYHQSIMADDHSVQCIINAARPFTSTVEDTCDMIDMLQQRSRLRIHHLFSNTNVARETTPDVIIDGQKMIEEVAQRTGIPIIGIGVLDTLIPVMPHDFMHRYSKMIVPMKLRMRQPWMDQ